MMRWVWFLFLFSQSVMALTCEDSSYLQSLIQKQNYRQAIQVLDQCLSAQPIRPESQLFNQLRNTLLNQYDIADKQIYQNFQTLFQVHPLKNTTVDWAKDLNYYYPFAALKSEDEQYYFYYDTGRLQRHTRGIALTKQAIIWKNLLGAAQRIEFSDIKKLELIYEYGLSLTAWKLRINQTADIRLSKLPDNMLLAFLSAMKYFIQAHSKQHVKLIISTALDLTG